MKGTHKKRLGVLIAALLTAGAVWVDVRSQPWPLKLGLDLQGGTSLLYEADTSRVSREEAQEALAGVRDVIERRVNLFGVSEPVVQTNKAGDKHRIVVQLAGVHDPQAAKQLIGETPTLEFRVPAPDGGEAGQFNVDEQGGLRFVRTELTGKQLDGASVSFDQVSNVPQVNLEFNREGTELFAELTREHVGQRIAIYIDGALQNAPVVQSEIANGRAVISGYESLDDAKKEVQRLNAGALPIPIELVSERTVGPALGQESVRASVAVGAVGLAGVIVWMLVYYGRSGVVAAAALVLYAIYFLAAVKLLGITLTLAGVAGFILTVGMAVDANVLIFESWKENLRDGRSMGYSLREGFKQAWQSIKAANVSSLIAAAVLYAVGTSIVRGFALTFGLGIALSMLTAVFISRRLMEMVYSREL